MAPGRFCEVGIGSLMDDETATIVPIAEVSGFHVCFLLGERKKMGMGGIEILHAEADLVLECDFSP